jgi:acyl carrier protein
VTNPDNIRDRLQTVFRETFDDDAIVLSDEMTAEDLDDWDSVSHISLVLAVERDFGLTLNAAEIGSLENVGAMIALLRAKATR